MSVSTIDLPPQSALDSLLQLSADSGDSVHPPHLLHLARTIIFNLQHQHDWQHLTIHTTSPVTLLPLPRPLISGLPPKRVYIHPDEQVEILKAEHKSGSRIVQHAEREWVLPTHLTEKWSLQRFAEAFDAIGTVPEGKGEVAGEDEVEREGTEVGIQWRGEQRQKRVLLATLYDDSTVVYYIVHDGIVKPRQN